jgi:transposase
MQLTYNELLSNFRKGLRNGNWRKLRRLEKALFQASLWYSRRQGTIINELVVSKLSVLVEKLKVTKGARIFKRGYEKAAVLLSKGESVFAWAPSFREWLKDPDYVFWLGAGGLRIGT